MLVVGLPMGTICRLRESRSEFGSLQSEFEMLQLKYQTLDSDVACLNAHLDYQTAEIEFMETDNDQLSHTLERAREALDERQSCRARGCEARFDCFFKQREQGKSIRLRASLLAMQLQTAAIEEIVQIDDATE